MSNDNKPGLLSGLLLGAGFAGILMLPIILMRRLGFMSMMLVTVLAMTVFAAMQPYMHDWAIAEAAECSGRSCAADALAQLVGALPIWGWWIVALAGWILFILRYKEGNKGGDG